MARHTKREKPPFPGKKSEEKRVGAKCTSKKFKQDVIVTLMQGTMICSKFDDAHELIEHIAGGPVWTHQIPYVWENVKAHLRKVLPDYAEWVDTHKIDSDAKMPGAWKAMRKMVMEDLPETTVEPMHSAPDCSDPIGDAVKIFGEDRTIVVRKDSEKGE